MDSELVNIEWTKEAPEVPTSGAATYIWYWELSEKAPSVQELWVNRYLKQKKGWWATTILPAPLTNPLKGEGIKEGEEVEEELKKGVGKGKGLLK